MIHLGFFLGKGMYHKQVCRFGVPAGESIHGNTGSGSIHWDVDEAIGFYLGEGADIIGIL